MTNELAFPKSNGDILYASEFNGAVECFTATAGESITLGNAVYVNKSDNKVYVAGTGAVADIRFSGFALGSASSDETLSVQCSGVVAGLSSLTAGDLYYLGAAGAVSATASNILIGRAITTTTLQIFPNIDSYNTSVPIGTILPWAKSLTGVPSGLPANFVECDGSVLSDAESPLNGTTIPNLNGSNYFLRGDSTSGGTGGSSTIAETTRQVVSAVDQPTFYLLGGSETDNKPPYYNVVWIMRVK